MLNVGATFLAKGCSPWAILREAGIDGPNVALFKAEWNENLHPRDPATGRFIETGAGTIVAASAAQSLIAGGATEVGVGLFALASGAILSLTVAGWLLSHGPKGDIGDGASYWLPGVRDNAESSEGGDPPDRPQRCEDLYRIDSDTCGAIARRRGARIGAACYGSASERYAACLANKPIPPLNTWNN
jgi:hypothetical protein